MFLPPPGVGVVSLFLPVSLSWPPRPWLIRKRMGSLLFVDVHNDHRSITIGSAYRQPKTEWVFLQLFVDHVSITPQRTGLPEWMSMTDLLQASWSTMGVHFAPLRNMTVTLVRSMASGAHLVSHRSAQGTSATRRGLRAQRIGEAGHPGPTQSSGLRIMCYNISSIRRHFDEVMAEADRCKADLICVQETKLTAVSIPAFANTCWHCSAAPLCRGTATTDQACGGVAVLGREPLTLTSAVCTSQSWGEIYANCVAPLCHYAAHRNLRLSSSNLPA